MEGIVTDNKGTVKELVICYFVAISDLLFVESADSFLRGTTVKMNMTCDRETRDSLPHPRARDHNKSVITTVATVSATVTNTTTETTSEVRHDGPRH